MSAGLRRANGLFEICHRKAVLKKCLRRRRVLADTHGVPELIVDVQHDGERLGQYARPSAVHQLPDPRELVDDSHRRGQRDMLKSTPKSPVWFASTH